MSHMEMLATMRAQLASKDYSGALRRGRSELARGCDSSELRVLMATAGMLGEGEDCSLDEVRAWLEGAVTFDPSNVDAKLELAHFLDAVADEPELAVPVFEAALEKSIDFMEAALDGLSSIAHSQNKETQERLRALRERARSLLGR